MIIIRSFKDPDYATGTSWHTVCEVCMEVSTPTGKASPAVAWALEHQRRCKMMTGQPVEWHRETVNMGLVTPMLVLDTELDREL